MSKERKSPLQVKQGLKLCATRQGLEVPKQAEVCHCGGCLDREREEKPRAGEGKTRGRTGRMGLEPQGEELLHPS